ncbi:MAG: PBP1A family penicillin-binding protein [Pseudomonadota bacterium]
MRARPRPRRYPQPRPFGRAARYAADAGVVVLTGVGALAVGLVWFARDLPSTDGLWRSDRTPALTLLAADGSALQTRGPGAPVRLADLPPHVPQAVLAVEDRNFRHHVGVNPLSVVRAFVVNTVEGEVRQGGSTITQQLAKNVFLSPEKTLKRKVQELLLAFWLERRFTKDEILTLYLNRVYFGGGAYGVDAASRRYFAKPARNLSIGEAAVLAGLLKAPSRYAPTRDPQAAGARARLVLTAMEEAGFVDAETAARAAAAPVRLARGAGASAPYFADYARAQSAALVGGAPADLDADLVVKTTLAPDVQRAVDAALADGLAAHVPDDAVEVAAVVMDADGAVLAMAGGRRYETSQFNRAVQARRQPGSAFKPFVYLAALEAGAAPETQILDAPVRIGGWSPDNYKSKYYGEVSYAYALALSLNSAAVRVQERVGRGAVRLAARRMGLDADLSRGASLALGVDETTPLGLAAAYAPFANGGYRVVAHGVSEIATAEGQRLYAGASGYDGVAVDAATAESMNRMLRAVAAWGTGKNAALDDVAVYGKTGTSQDSRDAWFVGHAGGLVAVVWLGRDDNAPMDGVTGGGAPARLWRGVMRAALDVRANKREPLPFSAAALLDGYDAGTP